jgi:hypothetical protein
LREGTKKVPTDSKLKERKKVQMSSKLKENPQHETHGRTTTRTEEGHRQQHVHVMHTTPTHATQD